MSTSAFSLSILDESLRKSLECPIDLTPLTTCVYLLPCYHMTNQVALERLCAHMRPTYATPILCPLCRTNVVKFYRNYNIRNLVTRILEIQNIYDGLEIPSVNITYKTRVGKTHLMPNVPSDLNIVDLKMLLGLHIIDFANCVIRPARWVFVQPNGDKMEELEDIRTISECNLHNYTLYVDFCA